MKQAIKAIEVKNIEVKYQNQTVLENISFSINQGDYVALIGPNGAGKTTLLKVILGLTAPTSGEIKIFGQNSKLFKRKYETGYVPQKIAQIDTQFPVTVWEVVASGRFAKVGILKRLEKKDINKIREVMVISKIDNLKDRLLSDLSGGERQRVFIARALAGEPKILILDEPTMGVDMTAKDNFFNLLEYLNRDFGLTIIFVSHDIDAISQKAKYVLCLNRKLVCHTLSKELDKGSYLEELYGDNMKKVIHK